jgi:hypothetical protein
VCYVVYKLMWDGVITCGLKKLKIVRNNAFDIVEQYEGHPDSKDCLAIKKNKQKK